MKNINVQGCHGADPRAALRYLRSAGGDDTEDSYPYTGRDGSRCKFHASDIGATEHGMKTTRQGDEQDLKAAVANLGPVSIAIDANHTSFHHYSGGVYSEPRCRNTDHHLTHAVLIVGYGTDEETGEDYWLVKNSWGTTWGDQGYIKMRRNANNMCGVATEATIPLV